MWKKGWGVPQRSQVRSLQTKQPCLVLDGCPLDGQGPGPSSSPTVTLPTLPCALSKYIPTARLHGEHGFMTFDPEGSPQVLEAAWWVSLGTQRSPPGNWLWASEFVLQGSPFPLLPWESTVQMLLISFYSSHIKNHTNVNRAYQPEVQSGSLWSCVCQVFTKENSQTRGAQSRGKEGQQPEATSDNA